MHGEAMTRSKIAMAMLVTLLGSISACRKSEETVQQEHAMTGLPTPTAAASAAVVDAAAATAATPTTAAAAGDAAPAAPAKGSFELIPADLLAKASTAASIGECALDVINGAPANDVTAVKKPAEVALVGWAADAKNLAIPPVIVVLESPTQRYFINASRSLKRPDVAKALKVPALVDAGYAVNATTASVAPGIYAVKVVQTGTATLLCDTRRKLDIR
jgi:hypothetical protein